MKKQDLIKRLHDDDLFKEALAKAKDDNERRVITSIVEDFVGTFADALGPLVERAKNDPAFAEQLRRGLADGSAVLSDSEPAASGSH